jgi:hypothetical protein
MMKLYVRIEMVSGKSIFHVKPVMTARLCARFVVLFHIGIEQHWMCHHIQWT